MGQRNKKTYPGWLQPRWERQKRDTATRVEVAVSALQKDGAEVTYASICQRVSTLFGLSISPNTIKRNEFAYRIYLANRRPPRRTRLLEPLLLRLIDGASDQEKRSLQSKTARKGSNSDSPNNLRCLSSMTLKKRSQRTEAALLKV